MEHCELILDRAFKRRVIFTEMSVQIRFKILWSAIDLFQPGNPVFVRGHGCLSRNAVISVGPRNYWWESLDHGDWFRKLHELIDFKHAPLNLVSFFPSSTNSIIFCKSKVLGVCFINRYHCKRQPIFVCDIKCSRNSLLRHYSRTWF